MATNIDIDLLQEWTRTQLGHASRAICTDQASFNVHAQFFTPMEGVSALDTTAHDWDDPVPARIDPQSIHVDGITHVGGIDIGYRIGSESGEAIAAMVILEYPSMKLKHTFLLPVNATQPYFPSYLSMRELDHVLMIYDHTISQIPDEDQPQIIFVDGFGRWHERQAGLATALGVERNVPTIGIGKEYQPLRPDLHKFVGKDPPVPMSPWPDMDHFRLKQKSFRQISRQNLTAPGHFLGVPLYKDGPLVGAAVYTTSARIKKGQLPSIPSYISPGHCVSLATAIALTMTCCVRPQTRLPEPIIMADRVGRDELKRMWGEDAA